MQTIQTISIPTWNLTEVLDKIEKLRKRVARKGLEGCPFQVKVGETSVREVYRDLIVEDPYTGGPMIVTARFPSKVNFTEVTIMGGEDTFTLPGGWKLLGTGEPLQAENGSLVMLGRCVPGREIPLSYLQNPTLTCMHCNLLRNRKQFIFVQNEEGQAMQVGTDCAADFLGHETIANILAQASFLEAINTMDEGFGSDSFGFGKREGWDILKVVTVALAVIRAFGWVSRTKAEELQIASTAELTREALDGKLRSKGVEIRPSDAEEAARVLAWASALEPSNSYTSNAKALATVGFGRFQDFGLIVSLPASYQRELEKAQRAAEEAASSPKVREFFGEVGKRYKGLQVNLIRRPSYIEGMYGVTTLYKFEDAQGNLFSWFASGSDPACLDKGRALPIPVEMDATVKAHSEYQGQKETQVTRAKVR